MSLLALRTAAATFPNAEVEARRARGGAVVGYACPLLPVELLDAAGLLAYRIRGRALGVTDRADARMSRANCGFCRATLQLALEGHLDFLDGVIETNGCDQLRGMFEGWQYEHPTPFFHYLQVPHVITAEALDYLEGRLRALARALEARFDVTIDDDALRAAIEARAALTARLGLLDELRRAARPKLSGAEALEVFLAGGVLPPARFDTLLASLLEELEHREGLRPRARLVLGGSATDELDLLRDIEALDAVVVADTLCLGSRLVQERRAPLDPGDDPLRALAERTLRASLCPRMVEELPARVENLAALVRASAADGVILLHNTFCDLHGIDNVMLRCRLEARGVPVLTLEKQYGAAADRGRTRTRVQAFLERLRGRP